MYNLKEEYKKIDEQIKPSEEFIKNLENNVKKELIERKRRKTRCIQVATICFLLVFISGGVFANDIGDFISRMFGNINKGIEIAIENNYIQNISTDYVVDKDVNIKTEYILIDENNINIVFNIKTNIEFDEIFFDEITITDGNSNIIYSNNVEKGSRVNDYELMENFDERNKLLSKKELMKTYNIYSMIDKYGDLENIKISINKINIIKENSSNVIEGKWDFDINIDKDIFYKDRVEYAIKEDDLLENYSILLTNTEMKVELDFKQIINLEDKLKKREQILIEDTNGKIYYCNDYNRIENDTLKTSFPISKFNNTDNLKLKIYLEDETLIFNVNVK